MVRYCPSLSESHSCFSACAYGLPDNSLRDGISDEDRAPVWGTLPPVMFCEVGCTMLPPAADIFLHSMRAILQVAGSEQRDFTGSVCNESEVRTTLVVTT